MNKLVKQAVKQVAAVCIGVTMIFTMSACGTKPDLGNTGRLVMGTNAEFPPFEYKEGNQVVGFDVEIAKKVAQNMGMELVIEDMDFQGLIPALQTGKINFIAAGMTVTEDRKKNVDFSDGYYEASQVIIVHKDNTEITGPDQLVDKKLGVQMSTTGADEAKNIAGAKVTEFDKGIAAVMDLKNKKIDAVILDSEPSKIFAAQNPDIKILDTPLTQEQYAIAVPKGKEELLQKINETLKEMKENGEYDALIEAYFNK